VFGSSVVLELTFAFVLVLGLQEPPSPAASPSETTPSAAHSHAPDGRRIKEPTKKKTVAPEWPASALRAGLDGSVVLECVIGVDGRVERIKTVSGYRSLAEAATAAVRKWRYTATELDGKPVPVIMTVTVNFKLPAPPRRRDVLGSVRDSDPEIRWAAVRWLGRYRPITGEQKEALESALRDASELVRTAAKESLARIEAKE
jgi:TonB family protein